MFERGKSYKRAALHKKFGGDTQRGISTPKDHPFIFLFSSHSGKDFGYDDQWRDGIFHYSGEGKKGNMEMKGRNRAVRDHMVDGKALHLFSRIEGVAPWEVRYEGEASYVDHYEEPALDVDDNRRKAIVFKLSLNPGATHGLEAPDLRKRPRARRQGMWTMPREKLRSIIESGSSGTQSREKTTTKTEKKRSAGVKVYVLRRADGFCEGCKKEAPFFKRNGRPYLEVHHIYRLADDGPDNPDAVVALCPNCHRRVHHGRDGDKFNRKLAATVSSLNAAYESSGVS